MRTGRSNLYRKFKFRPAEYHIAGSKRIINLQCPAQTLILGGHYTLIIWETIVFHFQLTPIIFNWLTIHLHFTHLCFILTTTSHTYTDYRQTNHYISIHLSTFFSQILLPMIPLHCHVYRRNPYIAPLFTLFQLSFFQNSFYHIDVICEVTAQVLFILSLRPFLVYCFSCPLFLPCTIRLSKHFYRITC